LITINLGTRHVTWWEAGEPWGIVETQALRGQEEKSPFLIVFSFPGLCLYCSSCRDSVGHGETFCFTLSGFLFGIISP